MRTLRSLVSLLAIAAPLCLLVLPASTGCSSSADACGSIECGVCYQLLQLDVTLDGGPGGTPTITDSRGANVSCSLSTSGTARCVANWMEPGAHTVTIAAAGYATVTISFTIAPAPSGCCTCPGSYQGSETLHPL